MSSHGLEVDKAKIDVILSLPYPSYMREVRSFLGHAVFYWRFIKDFLKITAPFCKLLAKKVDFVLNQACKDACDELKRRVTSASIIQPPNWDEPFEIMCDVNDYTVGAVLGQRIGKNLHVIAYVSCMLDVTQCNYHTTKKGAFCSGVCSWKIQVITTWYKSHCFYWSYSFKVSFEEKEVQTKID